ncbi:MAG TPA: hypothetical protein VF735_08955 [Pyrinomonadaceae bacterium]|jgi:hypothetical protein
MADIQLLQLGAQKFLAVSQGRQVLIHIVDQGWRVKRLRRPYDLERIKILSREGKWPNEAVETKARQALGPTTNFEGS